MRALAIFGALDGEAPPIPAVMVDDMVVRGAILSMPEPTFDAASEALAHSVLVRVSAFSCNFRDKGFMLRLQHVPAHQYFVIGSEFVGVVVAAGPGVISVGVGDRVIGQNHYTGVGVDDDGIAEGLPTNHASREYLVLNESKVCRIPANMPDEVAAGFGIGAQTSYSMIRRVSSVPGAKALVPSATSNTSLFLISALARLGVRVVATTTSRGFESRLRELGAENVLHVGGEAGTVRDGTVVAEAAREIDGFDAVFDPFFDLHLESAVKVLKPFGAYITCGMAAQNPGSARRGEVRPLSLEEILITAMMRNLSIVGNCIGLRSDLEQALRDYEAGRLPCVIDSVFEGNRVPEFLNRTFNDRDRFGKVIFRY